MLAIDGFTFDLKPGSSTLYIIDQKVFISSYYHLYIEDEQYCLDCYGGNYRAKELMRCLLDNNLAIVKRIKLDKIDYKCFYHIEDIDPLSGYSKNNISYIMFVFQLTPVMILNLC